MPEFNSWLGMLTAVMGLKIYGREKMKIRRFLALSLGLLVANAHSPFAEERAQRLGIGAEIAGIRLFGGERGDSNIHSSGGWRLAYCISDHLAIGYEGNYGYVSPRKAGSFFSADPDPELAYKTFLLTNAIDVSYYLPVKWRVQPFLSVGTGLLIWDLRTTAEGGSLFKNGFFYGQSVHGGPIYNTLLTAGMGADYLLSDRFGITGYLRLRHIFDQRADNIGTNDKNNGIFQIGVTLSYFFPGDKDTDADGIIDKHDAAPNEPEDFDNFQDDDGAPELDNDTDGVPDLRDKAPLIAEDIDGFEDDDGVPENDNDWDGIPDSQDKAPAAPEDLDGYQDDDGVPDPDNDNDGVMDISDLCQDSAETMNGYRDDDGCPDEVPKPMMEKGQQIILKDVNFQPGSAQNQRVEFYRIR